MGKSKRGTPKPDSKRAEKLAAQRARAQEEVKGPDRPFAGLAAEADLVALRAFVAAATAPAPLLASDAPPVTLASVLAGAVPAAVRTENGERAGFAAVQAHPVTDDPRGLLAAALSFAATAAPDTEFAAPADVPDLAEVLDPNAALDITVHTAFDWWYGPDDQPTGPVAEMVQQANDSIDPAARLDIPDAAGAPWWTIMGDKGFLRWVRTDDEDVLFNALARLHAAEQLTLGDGSRFAGSLRTHGLLVPVFELDPERHESEWVPPTTEFGRRLTEALEKSDDLSATERSSRDGLRARQLTLR